MLTHTTKSLLALLVSGALSSAAYAAPENLADFHAEMGSCDTCHVNKKGPTDDNLTYENAQCTSCHGNLKEVAETERDGIVSPHQSHLIGDVSCTSCHSGHEKSVTYCDSCHSFEYQMPFSGKWQREFVPVNADKAAQDQAIAKGAKERPMWLLLVQAVQV